MELRSKGLSQDSIRYAAHVPSLKLSRNNGDMQHYITWQAICVVLSVYIFGAIRV